MIAILDYGAGNLRSVQNTLNLIEAPFSVIRDAAGLAQASKIVLPGVGHFGQMMQALDQLRVREALKQRLCEGVPFLGICLGLQALFERSPEAPGAAGLGIFPGVVERFPSDARVPHMGWNTVHAVRESKLLKGIPHLYFAHSYYVPVCPQTAATCDYTRPYTAILEDRNIFGVQFHPEKSGPAGIEIVRRFVNLC